MEATAEELFNQLTDINNRIETPDEDALVIPEVPQVILDCTYLNGMINIKCDAISFGDIQQAVRALNRSRQSQREFKQRASGRVNRPRKPNIVFRVL